jgi:Zn finger protein HypA/HybF involved in hydrogenase expression
LIAAFYQKVINYIGYVLVNLYYTVIISSSLSEVIMNNSFEQLEVMVSELSLDKKHLLVKLLNVQVSGQSCPDALTRHQDSASTCPDCHS